MKIAFISDIHGNAVALDAVLKDLKSKQIDKICVLGDICYRGPEPKRSLKLIQSLGCEVIKGNADEWVVRGIREGEVPDSVIETMRIEREWTINKLEPTDIEYLESLSKELKINVNSVQIHAFHATPESLFKIVSPQASDEDLQFALMREDQADIYVYAHIHKPYIRYMNGKVIMNTGSVGLPFDGLKKASYGIVEIQEGYISTSIERVEFDVEEVIIKYQDENYPNVKGMEQILRNARV